MNRPGMAPADYRSSHAAAGSAERYDAIFAGDQYDGWIWQREQAVLRAIVRDHVHLPGFRLLDFACGTGRILGFLESLAGEAVGVDISADMLQAAARSVRKAKLVQADITRDGGALIGRFDVATAFRFFLNADETLRGEALAALRDALENGGVLVLNVHGNLWSLRLPTYILRRWVLRQEFNAISMGVMASLLRDYGFQILRIIGVGWCTPRIFRLLGRRWADRIEDLVERVPVLARFSTNLIYVCRKTG